MEKLQLAGAARKQGLLSLPRQRRRALVVGAEEVGEFLGDRKMRREGKLNQVEGQAEQDIDRAADAVEDAVERKAAARRAKNEE